MQGSPMLRFGQRGMSPLGLLFFIIIFLIILLIIGQVYIISSQCKGEESFIECGLNLLLGEETEAPEGAVTATGTLSGEFKGEDRSVAVTLHFPLEGGAVTGSFSGDCDGTIKGTYVRESSAISGEGNGSCAFVIPASGTFAGSVNREARTVHVSGSGGAAGFRKEGSLTLTY